MQLVLKSDDADFVKNDNNYLYQNINFKKLMGYRQDEEMSESDGDEYEICLENLQILPHGICNGSFQSLIPLIATNISIGVNSALWFSQYISHWIYESSTASCILSNDISSYLQSEYPANFPRSCVSSNMTTVGAWVTFSQNVYLDIGSYTLSFYVKRYTHYNSGNTYSIFFDDANNVAPTTIIGPNTVSTTQTDPWENITYALNITTKGSYKLTIYVTTTSSSPSAICFTGFTIL